MHRAHMEGWHISRCLSIDRTFFYGQCNTVTVPYEGQGNTNYAQMEGQHLKSAYIGTGAFCIACLN